MGRLLRCVLFALALLATTGLSEHSAVCAVPARSGVGIEAMRARATGGGPSSLQSAGTPVAAGTVYNVDARTQQVGSKRATFSATAEPSNPYGLLLRIALSAATFLDATVDSVETQRILFSWVATNTNGQQDRQFWEYDSAGQLALDTSRMSADSVYGWIRTTFRWQGGDWVPAQTSWELVSLAAAGAIDDLIDSISPTSPNDALASGLIAELDQAGNAVRQFGRYEVRLDPANDDNQLVRIYPADSRFWIDATGLFDDAGLSWTQYTRGSEGRPQMVSAGRLESDLGVLSLLAGFTGTWIVNQDCRSGRCVQATPASIPVRVTAQ